MSTPDKTPSLPRRMLVTLQLGGGFFALANVICVAILGYVYLASKHEPRTLEVKGSAKREITSDIVTWDGSITARDADLVKAYDKLKADADRAAKFIKDAGVADKQVTFSAVATEKVYERQVIPVPPPEAGDGDAPDQTKRPRTQIVKSPKIEAYVLTQTIHVESSDMEKVPALSRSITSLIKDGVEIESSSPCYLYSKLSELKIDMLGEATRDATVRATQIVSNANGSLGRLVQAKMGVMQINPKGVSDVSDTGNNDTTSLEKEILAVVTVDFELK